MATTEWNNYGLLRVPGFPAPTGQYAAGIVDLMHQGLLVRLYYPTDPSTAAGYEYVRHSAFRGSTYTKAVMDAYDISFSGLKTGAMNLLTAPRLPAVLSPPLLPPPPPPTGDLTLPSSNEPLANKDPPANEDSIADESSTNNAKDLPSNEGSTANRGPTSNEEPSESKEPTTENASCGIQQFPVIVFSHGLSAHFTCSNAICYDLASHGYVVASVEHKDGSSCIALKRVPGRGVQEGDYDRYIDEWIPFNKIQNIPMTRGQDIRENESTYSDRNSQVKTRAKEVGETYDLLKLLNEGGAIRNMLGGNYDFTQFKGRLDMNTATIIGHSFGGGTVMQTLYQDERFHYGIALDSWLFSLDEELLVNGIGQPLIFINVDTFQWPKNVARMMRLMNHEKGGNISMYTLKGAAHISQSDGPFIIIPSLVSTFQLSETDKYIVHDINMKLCHGFLKRYLHKDPGYAKGTSVPVLDGGEGSLEEYVIYGTNIDWKKALLADGQATSLEPEATQEPKNEEKPELKVVEIEAEPYPAKPMNEGEVKSEDPVQSTNEEPEVKAKPDPTEPTNEEPGGTRSYRARE